MTTCETFKDRLLDPLDREAAEHLEACQRCRAETAALTAVLEKISLSPPTASEHASLGALASSSLSAFRRERVRRAGWRRAATLVLVAAAAAMLVVLPRVAHLYNGNLSPQETGAEVSETDSTDPVEVTGVAFEDDSPFDLGDEELEGDSP